jgi:hypothetical protein
LLRGLDTAEDARKLMADLRAEAFRRALAGADSPDWELADGFRDRLVHACTGPSELQIAWRVRRHGDARAS